MNNITSILILIFLAITFYNLDTTNFFLEDNIDWLKVTLKRHL
jgi:hypothetical protein